MSSWTVFFPTIMKMPIGIFILMWKSFSLGRLHKNESTTVPLKHWSKDYSAEQILAHTGA